MFWAFADGLYPVLLRDPDWDDGGKSINALNSKIRDRMLSYVHEKLHGRPDLIEKVTPSYPPFGKRVLADAGWYDMLLRDNVSLETDGIAHVEADGIKLEDGRLIPVDTIVLATGFQAGRMLWPIEIIGDSGTIRDVWGESDPSAYLGMTVPGFPNMFVMYGPNTGVGHGGSVMFLAECQSTYILKCIQMVNSAGGSTIRVKPQVHDDYRAAVDHAMQGLVWSHPSVSSWYKNSKGRIIINQPDRLIDYWTKCQLPEPDDFLVS
jgi:4-hydroxyacetophenone monooxygenase